MTKKTPKNGERDYPTKILKLVTGVEIIAKHIEADNIAGYALEDPMVVMVKRVGNQEEFSFQRLVGTSDPNHNSYLINGNQILTECSANPTIEKYYLELLEKLRMKRSGIIPAKQIPKNIPKFN